MKQAEKFKRYWDRWKYPALVVALGIGVLLWPSGTSGRETTVPVLSEGEEVFASTREMERQMETILAKIDGVGELHLMLAEDTGAERRLAQDTTLSYSGSAAAPEDYQRKDETVLSGAGTKEPVVTLSRYPTWRGALVVCQGGDDAQVRLAVTQAVASLTGLGSDRITVVKCQ